MNLTTQNMSNCIGDVMEGRRKKDANTYDVEPERKPNEIMINIVSNASFSFLLFVSFGMNDDRKKQTERQIHTHIYSLLLNNTRTFSFLVICIRYFSLSLSSLSSTTPTCWLRRVTDLFL